jgi:dolichol-phosphate mannosyltransferase|tara:strand:- start:606 stop:1544 length:939 start_codon:yes stop_codon:yes gene_type:complete
MTTKKLTIISPVYNEEKNLMVFFSVLKNTIEQFKEKFLIEVNFVNDGSTDNSLKVCQQIKKGNSFVNIISLTRNFGHQNAILSALKTISSDLYLVLDSDLQQDPKNIKTILENFQTNDVNIIQMQKKYKNYESVIKRIFSRFFYFFFETFTKIEIRKGSSDFYLITRKVRDQIIKSNISYHFLRGFIHWSGFSKLYISYIPKRRIHGKSKYVFFNQLEFALTGVYYYQSKFFIYLFILSLFLFFAALIYIFYIIYSYYFLDAIKQTGWSTLVIALLFFGSMITLLNSFIIFIIMKIFYFVSNKPNFIIDDDK